MQRPLVLLAVLAFTIPVVTAGQRSTDDPMRALLAEVKLLRAAVERSASVGPRMQVLVARLQIQETRMVEASRRLDFHRAQEREVAQGIEMVNQTVGGLERMRTESNDPQERHAAEEQLSSMREQLERLERRHLELNDEESLLSQQLTQEQNRWAELNKRLEEIERSLTKP